MRVDANGKHIPNPSNIRKVIEDRSNLPDVTIDVIVEGSDKPIHLAEYQDGECIDAYFSAWMNECRIGKFSEIEYEVVEAVPSPRPLTPDDIPTVKAKENA